LIERVGRVPRAEMDRTFNNGVGFVLVVARRRVERVLAHFAARRLRPAVIGEIVTGEPGVSFV
jgi:phosphoribosylformylglycinamidine cyclo-ligase